MSSNSQVSIIKKLDISYVKTSQPLTWDGQIIVSQWYQEPTRVNLGVIKDGKVDAMILLAPTDLDPLQNHSNPWVIHYIWVSEQNRRQGVGCNTTSF